MRVYGFTAAGMAAAVLLAASATAQVTTEYGGLSFHSVAPRQDSWKLFTYTWANPPAGEHTVVSRAIDVHGEIQPVHADPSRKTRWENNEQHLRRIAL